MAKPTSNVGFRKVNVDETEFEDPVESNADTDDKFNTNLPNIQSALRSGDHNGALKMIVADYPRANSEAREKYKDCVIDVLSRIPKSEIESTLGNMTKYELENFMKFILEVQRSQGLKAATIQSCMTFQDALMSKIHAGGLMRVIVTRQK